MCIRDSLIVVCVLKQVFSLHEICDLINIQMESCPIEVAYDYFCDETEQAIKSVFFTRDFSKTSKSSNYTRAVSYTHLDVYKRQKKK